MVYEIKMNKENEEQILKEINTPQITKAFLNECIQISRKLKKADDKNE